MSLSYTDPEKGGEWEFRKISLIGAAKSLISQLSVGQDMTKISLPAVFLYPYSALELGCSRVVSHCDLLMGAETKSETMDRFLSVLRWHLSFTKKEKFEKKPYNPILGEWVYCFTHVDGKRVGYLSEQVEHHPPVAAIRMDFSTPNLYVDGTFTAAINFNGNSVTMINKGPITVHMPEHSEHYVLSTVLPSMQIKNVILGTRRMPWDGEVTISCEASGLTAKLNYKEEGWYCYNNVDGVILKDDKPIMTFNGTVGGAINITDLSTRKTSLLINGETLKPLKVIFPPTSICDERNCLNVWDKVNVAIEKDDMVTADAEKRVIEEAQRARRRENNNYRPRFFRDTHAPAEVEPTTAETTPEAERSNPPPASPAESPAATAHRITNWVPIEEECIEVTKRLEQF